MLKSWFGQVPEVDAVMQGNVEGLEEKRYILMGGILYQCRGQSKTQPLPECLRHTVMELGHSIPWEVHSAFQKTLNRIVSRFAGPGI